MLKYLTGAAALALAASAVMADPGGGKGGNGGGNPQAQSGGGGSGDKAGGNGGGGGGGDKAGGNGGGGGGGEKSRGNGGGKPQQAQGGGNTGKDGNLGNSGGKQETRAASRGADYRGPDKSVKPDRGPGRNAVAVDRARDDRAGNRGERGQTYAAPRNVANDGGGRDDRANWRWADAVPQRTRGLIAGCPPGLAKKNNGCLPPGLARGAAYAPVFYDSPNWWNFDDRWHDSSGWNGGNTRYYDGYLVRYSDRGIDSWLPLLGGALSPGNLWPGQYETQGLPSYYQDYYGVGQPDGYRYYDDTLYRVDPQSNAITAITALLTGDTFQVGQPMPSGYDVYNVPYSYRDRYPDGPDADYRYSDGSIYQVDPTTQIVQAVIGLLT